MIETYFLKYKNKIEIDFVLKATGEPPICLASSVFFALRNAVDDARRDAGELDWYQMGNFLHHYKK